MSWIESHQGLSTHPKLFRLASLTGYDTDKCIAKLHRLWWWALDYAEDGDLSTFSDEEIGLGIQINDAQEAKRFFSALRKSAWIDVQKIAHDKTIHRLHDWLDYAGRYLYSKYHSYNPKKYKEILNKYKGQTKGKPKGNPKGRVDNNFTYPKVSQPIPNLTLPNQIKEKERPAPPPPVDNSVIEEISRLSEILYQQKIFPKVPVWVKTQIKKNKNPNAILHCLQACLTYKPLEPWPYLENIMKIEDGNYNAQDFDKKAAQDKTNFLGLADDLKKLQGEKHAP